MAENKSTPPASAKTQFKASFGFNMASIQGITTPFAFRPEDMPILVSIFKKKEYLLPIKKFQPKLILDCGGNVGCAAVYFANEYPNAQIYSVEPEKNNFKLLTFNTNFYDNVHPIRSALWDKETFIRVEDKGFGVAGYMTSETKNNDSNALMTTTVSKLLAESGFKEIDLLKVDIEGAEKEVFGAPNVDEWLSKVKVLVIELHDRMKRGCSYEVFKAVSKYKWFFAFRGENLIFIRNELLN